MSRDSDWDGVERGEQELLGRCRRFVFGHPDSPGLKSKDVLYFTPCRRWLRIRSIEDWDEEECTLIESGGAAELFRTHGWPEPDELKIPAEERDHEVAADFKEGLADFFSASHFQNNKSVVKNKPSRDPRDYAGAVEVIERNALVGRLRKWSAEWPPALSEGDRAPPPAANLGRRAESLTLCQQEILLTLIEVEHRLTRDRLIEKMNQYKFEHGYSAIRNALPQLRKMGLVDNNQSGLPKGYGLSAQGRELAKYLSRDMSNED